MHDGGYADILEPNSSANQRHLVEMLAHVCQQGHPSPAVDAFVNQLTKGPGTANPVVADHGERAPLWRLSALAAVVTLVITITVVANSVAHSPTMVSARTVLVRAAQAATRKVGQVLERVYTEHVECSGLKGCRNLTFRVWSMRIDGTYVLRGTETVTQTVRAVYLFRLAHNMQSPMDNNVNFALVWEGPRLRSNRGELTVYFIHGMDDPGVVSGLAGTARNDGFISTGANTGYRLVSPRVFDHMAAYDLQFVGPGSSYEVFYAMNGYALLGMRGHGWSAALHLQRSISLCKSSRYLFRYFWKRNPGLVHCRVY